MRRLLSAARRVSLGAGLLALAWALGVTAGCIGEVRQTTTPRTATEMLLLTNAAGRALQVYDARRWQGRAVAIDTSALTTGDRGYLVSAFRERLSVAGARLVDPALAEVVLEVRAASQAINDPQWTFGVPALPLAHFDLASRSPEITFGYDPQVSWTKLQVWARDARTGEHLGRQVVWGTSRTSTLGDTWPATDYEALAKDALNQ